jgi:hypothetical protein
MSSYALVIDFFWKAEPRPVMGLYSDGKSTPTAGTTNCRAAGTVGDHFGMMVNV